MNWFIKIAQNSIRTDLINIDGKSFFLISGNTDSIKDKLGNLGFNYIDKIRSWMQDATSLQSNLKVLNQLSLLNIDLTPLKNIPYPPRKKDHVTIRDMMDSGKLSPIPEQTKWYLAKRKTDGTPILLSRDKNSWRWFEESGQNGFYSIQEVGQQVTSVKDQQGKPYSGTSTEKLFRILGPRK